MPAGRFGVNGTNALPDCPLASSIYSCASFDIRLSIYCKLNMLSYRGNSDKYLGVVTIATLSAPNM